MATSGVQDYSFRRVKKSSANPTGLITSFSCTDIFQCCATVKLMNVLMRSVAQITKEHRKGNNNHHHNKSQQNGNVTKYFLERETATLKIRIGKVKPI